MHRAALSIRNVVHVCVASTILAAGGEDMVLSVVSCHTLQRAALSLTTLAVGSLVDCYSLYGFADANGFGFRDTSWKAVGRRCQAILQPASMAHVRTGCGLHGRRAPGGRQQVQQCISR